MDYDLRPVRELIVFPYLAKITHFAADKHRRALALIDWNKILQISYVKLKGIYSNLFYQREAFEHYLTRLL